MLSLTLICGSNEARERHETVQQDKCKAVVVPRQTVFISGKRLETQNWEWNICLDV